MTTVESSSSSMDVTLDVHEALFKACRESDLEAFVCLLPEISNINHADTEKETALHHSATSGAASIVKILLAHPDVDVNALDSAGHTPLIHAALKGHIEVSHLLASDPRVDLHAVDDGHETRALFWAARYGYVEVFEMLLKAPGGKQGINKKNKHGCTPIVFAACYGHVEIVRSLFTLVPYHSHSRSSGEGDEGDRTRGDPVVDLNVQDNHGCTALVYACTNNRTEILSLLLSYHTRHHPSHSTSDILLRSTIEEDDKIDPNLQDEHSDTALTYASWKGYTEIVRLLLSSSISGIKSIDFNRRNQHGCTALVLAACYGHTEVVRLLLKHRRGGLDKQLWEHKEAAGEKNHMEGMGHEKKEKEEPEGETMEHTDNNIDVNFQESHGCTSLIYASLNNYIEMVALLLDRKELNTNLQDQHGDTALTYASFKGHLDVVRLLLSVPNLDVNIRTKQGLSPIAIAAREGHLEIVELLLAHPANAKGTTTRHRDQALILASFSGHTLVVSLLLSYAKEHGGGEININAQGEHGDTALIYATWKRWVDVVRLLLDYRPHRLGDKMPEGNPLGRNEGEKDDMDLMDVGEEGGRNIEGEEEEAQEAPELDLNVRTQNGNTVLIIAVTHGYSEIIKLLLDHPAANTLDKKQLGDALRLASSYGRTEIVQMLRDFDNTLSAAV